MTGAGAGAAVSLEGFIDDYPADLPVLVVDDEIDVRSVISRCLRRLNLKVVESETLGHARDRFDSGENFSMVFLDRCLRDGDGVTFSTEILSKRPALPIVIVTGQGSFLNAEEALAGGAFAYIPKPCRINEIRDVVFRRYPTLSDSFRKGEGAGPVIDGSLGSDEVLVAHSPQMIRIALELRKLANQTGSVLVTGPSGTGKEVVARKIHEMSKRAKEAFVAVNCSAIPAELIESSLFGHEKGSFTGASSDHKGFFEVAQRGTIFLDEVTETSGAFQAKLLRVLQEHRITRVGSSQEIELDVRVIASSNRDLAVEVAGGRFREDLYYRLNRSVIALPGLKDRPEDIEPLAIYFAHRTVMKTGRPVVFSNGVFKALRCYGWPGNVRELNSVIDSAVQGCNRMVLVSDLPHALRIDLKTEEAVVGGPEPLRTLREAGDEYCLEVLRRCGGNRTRAADILDVHRTTINELVKKKGWKRRIASDSKNSH